jgi:hypothetical protein
VETNLHSLCRFEHGWGSQTTFPSMKGRVNRGLMVDALIPYKWLYCLKVNKWLYCLKVNKYFVLPLCLGVYWGWYWAWHHSQSWPSGQILLWIWLPGHLPGLALLPGQQGRCQAGWGQADGGEQSRELEREIKMKENTSLMHYNNPNTKPPPEGGV